MNKTSILILASIDLIIKKKTIQNIEHQNVTIKNGLI